MRVIKYIIPFVFITLVYGCSRRVIPDTVTEVRDTVIYIPADTVYNTINIKELCDTLYKRDTVIVKKRGRVNNIITIKNDTIRFTCSEDSLRLVIETMRKTQTVTKPNQWTPTHILLLLFLIAVIIGAVSNLFRK